MYARFRVDIRYCSEKAAAVVAAAAAVVAVVCYGTVAAGGLVGWGEKENPDDAFRSRHT